MKTEALNIALDALRNSQDYKMGRAITVEAVEIIEEALAQPEQCTYPDCNYPCMNLPDCKKPEQRSANEHLEPVAWRETHSKVIKALAAIVTVHTPDKLFDLDAIPRDPVMGLVQQIKSAIDGYKPPQRTWVGLTDEELELLNDCGDTDSYQFARAIETKLKDKNDKDSTST